MIKLRAKYGQVEIEIESEESQSAELIQTAFDAIEKLIELHAPPSAQPPALMHSNIQTRDVAGRHLRDGTINSAVSKLGGSTCRAVLEAAAIHLTLFEGKTRFTTKEWEDRAKACNSWKAKWSNEKALNRKRMIDSGFVIENSAGVYSLSGSARQAAESKLA